MLFATSAQRVPEHTPSEVNEGIRNVTWQHVYQHAAAAPETIGARLQKLDREWDIDRIMELSMALLLLGGLALTILISQWLLALPLVVALGLLIHSIQGWCPLLRFFRRRGYRTQSEIDQEKYALKALRGDFRTVGDTTTTAGDRAAQAFLAAQA
jgi:hypothetical protein